MKYAIQLSTTGRFYRGACLCTASLDEATLFGSYQGADEVRSRLNNLWLRRGVIVQVHITEAREVRVLVED